ncbi:hypothetical protein FRC09_004493 [Ceratobasidium sp. 395]|nr:hypothetical protein FRC09_004493 [Ceratobasidium sp. 395]
MHAGTLEDPIPHEVIVLILEAALGTPVSTPPSASDRRLRTSVLLLSHNIRDTFIKRIYNTVVLWSENAIRKFAEAIRISPLLGPLVLNLWAGNRGTRELHSSNLGDTATDSCVGCLERIISATPNLQRLYIAFADPLWSYKIQCQISEAVRHLVIPRCWLSNDTPLLTSLVENGEALRSIGTMRVKWLDVQDISAMMRVVTPPFQMTLEIYDNRRELRHTILMLHSLSLLRARVPWQRSVELISSPDMFERISGVLTRSRAGLEIPNLERIAVVDQEMDDEELLGIWLSNGEPLASPF